MGQELDEAEKRIDWNNDYYRREISDRDLEYASWVDRNYQAMNDGTYQSNDGRDVDLKEIREAYEKTVERSR